VLDRNDRHAVLKRPPRIVLYQEKHVRKNRISCVAIGAFCLPLCAFGQGAAGSSETAFDNEPFFQRIEALAHDAADGAEALQEHWPIRAPAREMRSNTVSYVGGGAPLVPGIDVRASEIRVRRTDPSHVVVANMQLSAPCISLDTVRARYPSAIVTGSPHNGSPDAYGTWSIFGPDGEIAFGFSYVNPKCVGRVTLVPGASPPA